MTTIYADNYSALPFGQAGENLVRQIVFDTSRFIERYGDGIAEVVARRSGESAPYAVNATQEASRVIWLLTSADTAIPGMNGEVELRWYVGEKLAKTKLWSTVVSRSITDDPSELPEIPNWAEDVLAAGAAAQEAAKALEIGTVRYDTAQELTEAQKQQARENIGSGAGSGGGTGNVSSEDIVAIVVLDRDEFEALPERLSTTLYAIRG